MLDESTEAVTAALLFDDGRIETPAFVYDEQQLIDDAQEVRAVAGPDVRLLLAMKAFTVEARLRTVAPLLDGLHASSLFEARLGRCSSATKGLSTLQRQG